MPKAERPVRVKQLYTSVTQTAANIYSSLSKLLESKGLSVLYIPAGSNSCEDCDVAVIGSVSSLFDVSEYLHEDMQVIVCDGPLVCLPLKGAVQLDYSNEKHSYEFEFRKLDMKALARQLIRAHEKTKIEPVTIRTVSFDLLGMLQQDNAHGDYVLSSFNRVQSSFDVLARNRLKSLMIEVFEGASLKGLNDFLSRECTSETHRSDAKQLLRRLKANLEALQEAFKVIDSGKSIETAAKRNDIPVFELTYLKRMRDSINSALIRTQSYTDKLAKKG